VKPRSGTSRRKRTLEPHKIEDGDLLGASQNLLSLRSSGNVSTTAQVNWNGLIPTVTVAAVGGGTVALSMGGKTRFLEPSYEPVSGYDQLIGEREVAMDRGLSLTGSTNFNVTATVSPIAGPAVSGDASASLDHVSFGRNHQLVHRKYQNSTNPGDIDEFWTTQDSINVQRTKFEGDLVSGLSTGSSQTIISEGITVGSVPPAVPLPAPPSVTLSSQILDGVQLALDVAGLVPVVGEACDATNVVIHVARGNKAEALISAAAMIPVAGAAVVSGKFASKATKALANNADKLDEIAEGASRLRMPDPRTRTGYDPAALHEDHILARCFGGTDDDANKRLLEAATNLRKGGMEGALKKYENYLIENGVKAENARLVIQTELDALSRDALPVPLSSLP
jgi:hypothetical protein